MTEQLIRDYHYHYFVLLTAMRKMVRRYANDAPSSADFCKLLHRIDNCLILVNSDEYFFRSNAFRFEMQLVMEQIGFDRSPYRQSSDARAAAPKARRKTIYPDMPSDPLWSSVSAAVFDDHMTTGTENTDDWGRLE